MLTSRLLIVATAAASIILMTLGLGAAAAASSSVECGQLSAYTAPDPLGPTDGSLQIGTLAAWDVLATATVSPAVTSTLPSIVNSGPTCLALDFDDEGNVTAIDFAASGTITGTVAFSDPYYVFDHRLIIPTFITDANPGLAALFVTSYQAGTGLTVTFTVDTATGAFTGFDGTASFCGTASVTQGGDGQVGDAIIPAAVLDAGDLDALQGAGNAQTCATVHATGTIDPDGGAISITTNVTIDVADATSSRVPTAPPTSVAAATADDTREDGTGFVAVGLMLLSVAAFAAAARRFRVSAAE